jgi:LacI family repressor for deo operon, udp, cdd, tsx, nupC, and nupG
VLEGDYTLQSGAAAAVEIASRPTPPDAVFCSNDEMAIGLMGGLTGLALDVPGDVAVVGFDDIEFAAMARPSLTTVHQPRREIGRTGARVLLDLLAGRPTQAHVRLETHLVERLSTRVFGR